MGDLAHHLRPVLVDLLGQPGEPRHDLVAVQLEVAERRRAVPRHHRRAADHRQPDAALGLLDVVRRVAVLGQAVLGVRGLVRGAHDPVAQRQPPEGERLQQRVGTAVMVGSAIGSDFVRRSLDGY